MMVSNGKENGMSSVRNCRWLSMFSLFKMLMSMEGTYFCCKGIQWCQAAWFVNIPCIPYIAGYTRIEVS